MAPNPKGLGILAQMVRRGLRRLDPPVGEGPLTRSYAQTLSCLRARPESVVTRLFLCQSLWPNPFRVACDAAVLGDHSALKRLDVRLRQHIRRLRKALAAARLEEVFTARAGYSLDERHRLADGELGTRTDRDEQAVAEAIEVFDLLVAEVAARPSWIVDEAGARLISLVLSLYAIRAAGLAGDVQAGLGLVDRVARTAKEDAHAWAADTVLDDGARFGPGGVQVLDSPEDRSLYAAATRFELVVGGVAAATRVDYDGAAHTVLSLVLGRPPFAVWSEAVTARARALTVEWSKQVGLSSQVIQRGFASDRRGAGERRTDSDRCSSAARSRAARGCAD